jgi:adenosylhomocysteine nucleosidase
VLRLNDYGDCEFRYNTRSMNQREVLILTPMAMEARAVKRALADFSLPPGLSLRFSTIGISACQLKDDLSNPQLLAIILAGFAGALRPDLRLGDVLIETHPADFPLTTSLPRGTIHTADQIIATPADKAALHQRTGACAVEMEFTLVREKMNRSDLPLIHVRCISDAADEPLEEILLTWIDPLGRPKIFPIAAGVLKNPRHIRTLRKLQSAVKAASPPLGKAVRQVVESLCHAMG